MGIEKKAKRGLKNIWTDKEVSLELGYASSTSCAITDCQWLSEGETWCSHWTATGSNNLIVGVCQRTSQQPC